jgi:hypothetical protein
LEFARHKREWWWTDPKNRNIGEVDQRNVEAAKVWELLRRTKTYPLLCEKYNVVVRQLRGQPQLFQMFHARIRSQFSDQIGFLLEIGGGPNLTWVELRADIFSSLSCLANEARRKPCPPCPFLLGKSRAKKTANESLIVIGTARRSV